MLFKKNILFSNFFLISFTLCAEILRDESYTQQRFQLFDEATYCEQVRTLPGEGFGGWSISRELFDYILKILPQGKTILELGSGWASSKLSEQYIVYSVEHDEHWLGKYNTNYIHAPIKNGWYDVNILQNALPQDYDFILVDGPTGAIGRYGFYMYLSLFKKDVPIILDDVQRDEEFILLRRIAIETGRKALLIPGASKLFAIIFPNKN